MSTLVYFQPSSSGGAPPFQFQATLNGDIYNVIVTWNIFGQRFYINLYDVSGTLVLARALSPSGPQFLGNLSWANGIVTAALTQPHLVPIGSVAQVTISQTSGEYDGQFQALATDEMTLTYPLAVNPGDVSEGQLSFDLNLLDGYGIGTLLFHDDSQQFEYS